MLCTVHNAEDGLSEHVSIRPYQRLSATSDTRMQLEAELRSAFASDGFSWRHMLCNDDFEVADLETEDEAREYAYKILWKPFFGR